MFAFHFYFAASKNLLSEKSIFPTSNAATSLIMEVQSNLHHFLNIVDSYCCFIKVYFPFKQNDAKLNIFEEKTTCSKSDKNRYIVEQLRYVLKSIFRL